MYPQSISTIATLKYRMSQESHIRGLVVVQISLLHTLIKRYSLTKCLWLDRVKTNSEIVTHIEGRLLDQLVVLFNYVAFQNGNFSLKVHSL